MAKGKRPTNAPATPWTRWVGVLVGLVVIAGIAWYLVSRAGDDAAGEEAAATEGSGPQPLNPEGGPTVEQASLVDVPPDSIVSSGPDAPSGIVISNDPRAGAADAPVVIVEFSDFQCPHCADFHVNTFPALRSLYGDRVRWYFVNRFYSAPHPQAQAAAIAAECADQQGRFWEYADQLYKRQTELGPDVFTQIGEQVGIDRAVFDQCRVDPAVGAEVAADQLEADRLRVDGTPTFYINGQKIVGAQPLGTFNEIIGPYFQ